MNTTTQTTPAKRNWANPELVIISKAANINGGPVNTLHEHNYTKSTAGHSGFRSITGPSHQVKIIATFHRQDFHS